MGHVIIPVMTVRELKERSKGCPVRYRTRLWMTICEDYHLHRNYITQKYFSQLIGCSPAQFGRYYSLYRSSNHIEPYNFK